jgi:hypothetical protein
MENISFVWTIILGLIIGVSANILTPHVGKLLGKVSASAKHRNEIKREIFNNSVQYLIDNPYDEINMRTEKNGRYARAYILMSAALILGLSNYIPAMGAAILAAMLGIYYFKKGNKFNRLVSAAWRHRKKNYPNIDLD